MMQQINLYQPGFRQQHQVISVGVMLVSVALSLLLFGGYYGYAGWQLQQQQARLQGLGGQIAQQKQRNEALARQFPVRTKSPQLERELEGLMALRGSKQKMLELLNSGVVGNSNGFSGYLEGMARQRIDNLWLSTIAIEAGGERMRIDGSALKAELLPKYIQQLAGEAIFAGREFALFSMNRGDGKSGRVDFSLRSAAEAVGAKR